MTVPIMLAKQMKTNKLIAKRIELKSSRKFASGLVKVFVMIA
jgi:hypothetical protein